MSTPVVRHGADAKLTEREGGHTMIPVYTEMMIQIALDYPSLPDPATLSTSWIRFYYEGLRPSLKAATKPRDSKG